MTSAIAQDAFPATYMVADECDVTGRNTPTLPVGEPLTDQAREEAIRRAGALMEKRYADFADTGCLAALGDAHRAMLNMKALVAGRSKDAVLRMEIQRGLI